MNFWMTTIGKSKKIAWITLAFFLFQPAVFAAGVAVDPNYPQTKVEEASNGTPVVQISGANEKGLSHNRYTNFNVGANGLILNNNNTYSQTQLAGWIDKNPNMVGKNPARVILNEVTSKNISHLGGYLEVAGQRADVIIANPNGIVGSGFGFINTSQATLTTGKPMIGADGALTGFQVTGGNIEISGQGMNALETDRVDLLSRTIQINAELHGQELNLIAGTNQINYASSAITALTNDPASQPAVAIDVAALGGMYAGRIRLIGTEKGVGVNSSGALTATGGSLTISSEGKIILNNQAAAAGDIQLQARENIENNHTLYSERDITAQSSQNIINKGNISAKSNLSLTGSILSNQSNLIAGNQINLRSSEEIINQGSISGQGNMTLLSNGKIANDDLIYSQKNVTIQGDNLVQNTSIIASETSLAVTAKNVISSGTIAAGLTTEGQLGGTGSLEIQATEALDLSGKTMASDTVVLRGDNIDLDNGIVLAKGNIAIIATEAIKNREGQIQGEKAVSLSGVSLDNTKGIISQYGTDSLEINTTTLINQEGRIVSSSGELEITSNTINNAKGTIASSDHVSIHATQINNTEGTIHADLNTEISATNLTNSKGQILAGENVTLTTEDYQGIGGSILAENDMTLTMGNSLTTDSTTRIQSGRDLTLTVGTLVHQGTIAGGNVASVNASSITNKATGIFSGNELSLKTTGNLTNEGLIEGSEVDIQGNVITNKDTIFGDDISITGREIHNDGAQAIIASTGDISLQASNLLHNKNHAEIYAQNNVLIGAEGAYIQNVINDSSEINAENNIAIYANSLTNRRTEFEVGTRAPYILPIEKSVGFISFDQYFTNLNLPMHEQGVERNYARSDAQYLLMARYYNVSFPSHLQYPVAPDVPHSDPAWQSYLGQLYAMDEKRLVYLKNEYDWTQHADLMQVNPVNGKVPHYYDPFYNDDEYFGSIVEKAGREFSGSAISQNQLYYLLGRTQSSVKSSQVTREEYVTKDSGAAKIQAGNNIIIRTNQNILNDKSEISAGNIIDAAGATFNNISQKVQREITSTEKLSTIEWGIVSRRGGWGSNGYIVMVPEYQEFSIPSGEIRFITIHSQLSNGPVTVKVEDIGSAQALVSGNKAVVIEGQNINNNSVGNLGAISKPQTPELIGNPLLNYTLPTSKLYQVNTDPNSKYLVEGNPRFTQFKNFITSDYMLDRLQWNPEMTQKRLGDGFYEQQLIKDQILSLVGRQYLGDYTDMNEQYQALLEAGVMSAEALQLTPGIALTLEQMTQLTTNMVWLEEKVVDGQKVLVPVVYLAQVKNEDLNPGGSLIVGGTVQLHASQNLVNVGTIQGNELLDIKGNTILNDRGSLVGGIVQIQANQDIINRNGTIHGNESVILEAGRDIISETTVTRNIDSQYYQAGVAEGLSYIGSEGNISLSAGQDIRLTGGAVIAVKNIVLDAGRDVTIDTVNERRDAIFYDAKNDHREGYSVIHTGTVLNAGENLQITSGRDTTLTGTEAYAEGNMAIIAGGNVDILADKDVYGTSSSGSHYSSYNNSKMNFTASTYDEDAVGSALVAGENITLIAGYGSENKKEIHIQGSSITSTEGIVGIKSTGNVIIDGLDLHDEEHSWSKTKKKGTLSKTTTTTEDHILIDYQAGSFIYGDNVVIQAGNDLNIEGSQVLANHDVDLYAQNDVNIVAAEGSIDEYHMKKVKKSGVMSGGTLGVFVGTEKQKNTDWSHNEFVEGSTIGSIQGDVNVIAGKDVNIIGSDVIAQRGDIYLEGDNVTITSAVTQGDAHNRFEYERSGFTSKCRWHDHRPTQTSL